MKYLYKMNLTPQAMAAMVENPHDRLEALRPLFEAMGGKLIEYWFAIDQAAVYSLAEIPESREGLINQLAAGLAVMASGSVSSAEGSRLLSASEAVEAMKKAKSFTYRPAGSTTAAKK